MIERDVRHRGRWTRSTYECLFGDSNHERKSLYTDHFISSSTSPFPFCLVAHLSPPEDEKLSVKAVIHPDRGQVLCRYFPIDHNPGTYVCFSADPSSKTSAASASASAFDTSTGLGGWIHAPLDKRLSGAMATIGVRWTSPYFSCGAVTSLRDAAVREGWIVARYKDLIVGARVKDQGISPSTDLREKTSLAASYSPSSLGGRNKSFVAALEVVEGSCLKFAISQHLALVRQVLNPLEDKNVIGITSYLSYGLKMALPINQQQGNEAQGVEAAVSYQVNKNWLLKAKCGVKGFDATVGFRIWTFPSLLILFGGSYNPNHSAAPARWGITLQMENHGDLLYERGGTGGSTRWERGRAVLQRHEASAADARNHLGINTKGIVRIQDYSDKLPPLDGLGINDRFL